ALGLFVYGLGFGQSIFAAGLVLIVMTLGFNILGHIVRKKFRETY
ncbi:MAG: phosphate ABC transporter permease subunit PstC, partial [Methylophilaceae bacterium]